MKDYSYCFNALEFYFSDDDLENTENITLEDIRTKVMLLNDKIQNNMWFV